MQLSAHGRILIVPDSYKGTLTSKQVASAIRAGLSLALPEIHYTELPLADGGEGSSTICGELLHGTRVNLEVTGPEGTPVTAFYYKTPDNRTLIELAAASGLPLCNNTKQSAKTRTTYGTGELIKHAIQNGARDITLFLGGSATTDGGVGMAKALGFRFLDKAGIPLPTPTDSLQTESEPPTSNYPGEQLHAISQIDPGDSASLLKGVTIKAVCDVKNPLFGPAGAAHIYGPQKGLTPSEVITLDSELQNLARQCTTHLKTENHNYPGAGAAGGSGFAVLTFLKGELVPGADYFLDLIGFDELARASDLIITGEGRVDEQSVTGKLLCSILARATALGKPVISLSGAVDLPREILLQTPLLTAVGVGRTDSMTNPAEALQLSAFQLGKLLAAAGGPIKGHT